MTFPNVEGLSMSNYYVPAFPLEEVNRAAKRIVETTKAEMRGQPSGDLGNAVEVIDNWRAAHAYPSQVFFMTVKRHSAKIGRKGGVAQRIKRMPSIVDKLCREDVRKLTQMQDIAGVRSVLQNLKEVSQLRESLTKSSWAHEMLAPKDYIQNPKASGYRGIHLKYKYSGEGAKAAYNNLKIEIQLRTQLQHQWATAVEAADAFTQQSIKQSRGDPAWNRFFALMSSIFALKEKCPLVPDTPATYDEIAKEIYSLNAKHHIANVFAGFAKLMPRIEGNQTGTRYFLLMLDPVARRARIRAFMENEAKLAQHEYSIAERNLGANPLTQVVLVSTSSINALKRVYPNYFLDTVEFDKAVTSVLQDAILARIAGR